ncbi:MAG: aspartate aminotransferase family protein [Actinomycetota bacterium]
MSPESVSTQRLGELIEAQERALLVRQNKSALLIARAGRSLAGGVTSSWQISRPQTVWVEGGRGSKITDVDGNEYVDLHGGYGAMAVGHAHPKIVEAISSRIAKGSHFGQPTEDAIVVAEDLAQRFGLPLWRFCNSGTEATMDAVHLMRVATGRTKIVKIEGAYHGHHDSVHVSFRPDEVAAGSRERPNSVGSAGIPRAMADLTIIAPFNDAEALASIFDEHSGQIAGLIIEPVMMNAGIIEPDEGYLTAVRDITRRHGALLAFDEVKTGVTIHPGGATALFGVKPDIICLAKSIGGGLPCGAIGGTDEVMSLIVSGQYEQVGTFNGNPLTLAAARATLTEILTDDAYAHFEALKAQLVDACTSVIETNGLPAYVVALGAKGRVTFSPNRVRDYRGFLASDDRFSHCHWLYQFNGAVFLPPWGKSEQWMLSVQHTSADVERFIDNFAAFGEALAR